MNRVESKSFREYFRWDKGGTGGGTEMPIQVRYRHWFHPLTLYLGIMAYCVILGTVNRIFWLLDGAFFLYLVFLYWQTKRTAQWLFTERIIPQRIFQNQELSIEIKVQNRSRFDIGDVILRDAFTASTEREKFIWIEEEILKGSSQTFTYKIECDAPLGHQSFGPLQLVITDPIGIFEFRVIDDREQWLEVVPDPKKRIQFDPPPSMFSQPVSSEVCPRPGNSTSFFELRGYVPGDPLRKIAWRMSSKFQKFLVKEFEEAASNDFSMFLDMDSLRHFGNRESSTWALMKEASIALLMGEAAGRRFQILSDDYQLPYGAGDSHMAVATKGILGLEPVQTEGRALLAMAASGVLPYGSSLVYVGPTPLQSPSAFLAELMALQLQGIRVAVLLIDTSSFLGADSFVEVKHSVKDSIEQSKTALTTLKFSLEHSGINCSVIRNGDLVA